MDKPVKKVCIVSPYSYPLFNEEMSHCHFGGWEVRTYLIAKELAKRGRLDVSIVVWDHGQPRIECREGVTLYSWTGMRDPSEEVMRPEVHPLAQESRSQTANRVSAQLAAETPIQPGRVKRWLRKRLPPKLWFMLGALYGGVKAALSALYRGCRSAGGEIHKCAGTLWDIPFNWFDIIGNYPVFHDRVAIYEEIDADLYMVPGNHNRAAEVACFCRKRGRKYIFLSGSDMDYHHSYKNEPDKCDIYGVPGYLMTYTINSAALHIVQNEYQSECLRDIYGCSSVVMRNPVDLTLFFGRNPKAENILWVGSADDRVRRPSMVLELARRMRDCRFVILMVPALPETDRHCREIAATLPNVTVVGRTSFREVEKYYADARLLVNTSVFEGFPNSFLQAAKYGVPIVAAKVDPGGMLTHLGCGLTSGDDLEQLERNVRRLMNDDRLYGDLSANCMDYVKKYHDKALIIPQLEDALLSIFQ